MTSDLITAQNVTKYYHQNTGFLDRLRSDDQDPVRAVDDVSLTLDSNEVQGIIGESGCGKTTLLNLLLGLEDRTGGTISFHGDEFDQFSRTDWKEFRRRVQVIFQDPFNSLDPKMSVRKTLTQPLNVHDISNKDEQIRETLQQVELNPVDRYLDQYPHQLSGGERQRVSIARALVLEPDVLLADEPVSMLDVSTQASILKLLSDLIDEEDLSMIYISHDLSTVSYICDTINVMYLGRFVETAPTMAILNDPKHPYAEELISAVPVPNPHFERDRTNLTGSTPDPVDIGGGCRFRNRCPERMDICDTTPAIVEIEEGHACACHLHYDHDPDKHETHDESASTAVDSHHDSPVSKVKELIRR